MTVAVDVDGTLLLFPAGHAWSPATASEGRANEALVRRLRALMRRGVRVAVVTGRPLDLAHLTRLQVDALLGTHVPIRHASASSAPTMSSSKARHLTELGASLYIGDSLWDARAARLSGVPFEHAGSSEVLGVSMYGSLAAAGTSKEVACARRT